MHTATTKKNQAVPMTNIWDQPVTIQIGSTPGSGVDEYTIKPGETQSFPEGYCKPVPAAGQDKFLPAILARESTRTWDDGVRRPTLVPADTAKEARAEIDRQLAAAKKNSKTSTGANAQ